MVKGVNRSYEAKVRKKYSEFKEVGIGTWNAVSFNGRWVNMYTDGELLQELFSKKIASHFKHIKKRLVILDFGGGDGTLTSIVSHQLMDDFEIEAYNLDLNKDSLEICKRNNPKLKIVEHNLLEEYKKDFADVILCRFVMQYQSREEQIKLIKNAYHSLKEGGLFFVLWPLHSNKKYINDLEAEVVHIITGKDTETARNSRYFASRDEMADIMKDVGFEIIFSNEDDLKQYYTVSGWADRFDLTKEQEQQLGELFENYSKMYPEAFEIVEGMKTHHGFHCLVVGKR